MPEREGRGREHVFILYVVVVKKGEMTRTSFSPAKCFQGLSYHRGSVFPAAVQHTTDKLFGAVGAKRTKETPFPLVEGFATSISQPSASIKVSWAVSTQGTLARRNPRNIIRSHVSKGFSFELLATLVHHSSVEWGSWHSQWFTRAWRCDETPHLRIEHSSQRFWWKD